MNIPRIAVLGSANIDLVCRVPRLPRPGETVRATSVSRYRGGKGANQAVAAARLGADVTFYGMVGQDSFGDTLLDGFRENGVDASAVDRPASHASGTATIWVAKDGENSIVIADGANGCVDPAYVDRHLDSLAKADVLLLQFEIPPETVAYVLRCLPAQKPTIVLDPAPASLLDGIPAARIACLTPNEEELLTLSGQRSLEAGTRALHNRGAQMAICTLGERGAFVSQEGKPPFIIPSFPVVSVDSTAAGDAFAAALAVGLARFPSGELEDIVRYACAAGALAVTKEGAWPSLPTESDVQSLLKQ
jgi:ribokinase